jgi:hypothetical protein
MLSGTSSFCLVSRFGERIASREGRVSGLMIYEPRRGESPAREATEERKSEAIRSTRRKAIVDPQPKRKPYVNVRRINTKRVGSAATRRFECSVRSTQRTCVEPTTRARHSCARCYEPRNVWRTVEASEFGGRVLKLSS